MWHMTEVHNLYPKGNIQKTVKVTLIYGPFLHVYDRIPTIWNESIAKSVILHKFQNFIILHS